MTALQRVEQVFRLDVILPTKSDIKTYIVEFKEKLSLAQREQNEALQVEQQSNETSIVGRAFVGILDGIACFTVWNEAVDGTAFSNEELQEAAVQRVEKFKRDCRS